MNFNDAKHILNHQNKTPYSDTEIKEIMKILGTLSEMICDNLTQIQKR
jgi:hypothetical protein